MGRLQAAAQWYEAWMPSAKSAIFTFLTNQRVAPRSADLRGRPDRE